MTSEAVLKKALERERAARIEAEALLEEKNRQLYYANEERATAAELKRNATLIQMILQTAADGIITFEYHGLIESANPAANRIFGYELVGMNIRDLIPSTIPHSAEFSNANLETLDEYFWTETNQAVARKAMGKRSDGKVFEMELAASRVEVEDRTLFTWIFRDITNRRSLERQLAIAQKLESVGQLAAGIAHEINTPIQFIGDNLTFMKRAFAKWNSLCEVYEKLHLACNAGEDTSEIRREIDRVVKKLRLEFLRTEFPKAIQQSCDGASRVAHIVRAMKEFSHPGFQQKSDIDLRAAIESTVTVSRNEWKYVADLELNIDPNLPPVPCYPADLNQAMLNLVVNAAHAIGDRNATTDDRGTITISARAIEDYVEIRITDTGTGIPLDVRDRIFDPFFTTKSVGKGTGQGLSIVYSAVVEKHAGTIDLESKLGQGTTFILRLPLHQKQETVGAATHANTHSVR